MTAKTNNDNWIIQRKTHKGKNTYEEWVRDTEHPMSQAEAERALKSCEVQWPEFSFRAIQTTALTAKKKPRLNIPKAQERINVSN